MDLGGILRQKFHFEARAKKESDVKVLSDWIAKTADSIQKSVPQLRLDVDGDRSSGRRFFYALDSAVDFDALNRRDLRALQPVLERLHVVCKEADIAVEMAGFDLLPRVSVVSQSGYTCDANAGKFMISVDGRHEYNYAINPFSQEELDAKFKKPASGYTPG